MKNPSKNKEHPCKKPSGIKPHKQPEYVDQPWQNLQYGDKGAAQDKDDSQKIFRAHRVVV